MLRLGRSGLWNLVALAVFTLCMASLCSCARPAASGDNAHVDSPAGSSVVSIADQDRALQEAAALALGDREGAVLIIDPHSGRIRAVVNPRLAFEQAFPPGSTMKIFTALTALRSGLIDGESRAQCRGRYRLGDYQVTCSHPKSKTPFNPAQAIGYSCNCYFADLGSRLGPASFVSTLNSFGFGKRTGVNAGGEAEGTVPSREWNIGDAVGEGKDVTVTAVQLLTAYSALFNGGHLYRPQQADPQKDTADEQGSLHIDPSHRRTLIQGMRSAVEYGTAAEAGLARIPLFVFGKTGTSSASNGFGRHGWFAGFAAKAGSGNEPQPEAIGLGLVVLLKRGRGVDGARVARPIFDAYARFAVPDENANSMLAPRSSGQQVRVANIREGTTETLSLEDYVLGVTSAEASTEDQAAALEAQAITTRTFAVKNLGRHASDGYDFCSLTHCELYKRIEGDAATPPSLQIIRRAVATTAGKVLRDDSGRLVDAYFSAACGGVTANIQSLWGVPAPSYLRGVRDDYCATGSQRNWTEEISRARLAEALASDQRSDVGRVLNEVIVSKRDPTGRAELVSLEGARRRQLRGWEFKIIVGRALGWSVLKSSRFEVSRRGDSFFFRGSGFGHGLGLCQQGAHVMARRGMSSRQILDHYFPGTRVGEESGPSAEPKRMAGIPQVSTTSERPFHTAVSESPRIVRGTIESLPFPGTVPFERISAISYTASRESDCGWFEKEAAVRQVAAAKPRTTAAPGSLTLSSEHFRVGYPSNLSRQDVEDVIRILESARLDMMRRLAGASLVFPERSVHEVILHPSTQDFMAATGQPWWSAGATRGRKSNIQPVSVLRRRGVLTSTLRHEYAHAVIEVLGHGRTARWLAEGLAIQVAGEGAALKRGTAKTGQTRQTRLGIQELERKLEHPESADEMRLLYVAAYWEVLGLIRQEGESNVWKRISEGK